MEKGVSIVDEKNRAEEERDSREVKGERASNITNQAEDERRREGQAARINRVIHQQDKIKKPTKIANSKGRER